MWVVVESQYGMISLGHQGRRWMDATATSLPIRTIAGRKTSISWWRTAQSPTASHYRGPGLFPSVGGTTLSARRESSSTLTLLMPCWRRGSHRSWYVLPQLEHVFIQLNLMMTPTLSDPVPLGLAPNSPRPVSRLVEQGRDRSRLCSLFESMYTPFSPSILR